MTWRVAVYDLDGSERIHDLPWSKLMFTHTLNAPGAVSVEVSMAKVARDDIEPGKSNIRIYQGATLRGVGHLWNCRVNAAADQLRATAGGPGMAGLLTKRTINWETRYEPETEVPGNLNTQYGLTQQEILYDLIALTQAEPYGDLGVTPGTHTGWEVQRARWYCEEDGLYLADVFDDFTEFDDGIDWAITPTLTDPSLLELNTWSPARGSDLSGSIVLDGGVMLDTLDYEIDTEQMVTRGHSVAEGDCDPPVGDVSAANISEYMLLEDHTGTDGKTQEEADAAASGLLSTAPVVASDIEYQLSNGPALGAFDVGDLITVQSPRTGWELDVVARVEEIQVTAQLPDDDEHTFVRVSWSEEGVGS